jgi:hypothetical protein
MARKKSLAPDKMSVSALEIIFLHFVAKHLRHQDTKTQR